MNKILQGDSLAVLKTLPDELVDCCITSPPYWGLRDYGVEGQLGLEKTPEEFIKNMVDVFHEVKRVLKNEGTLWLNIGDSYAAGGNGGGTEKQDSNRGTLALKGKPKKAPPGLKPKDLVGIPWMLAFALRAEGWYLRQDIIWAKPNPMPESVTDRCTKSHEYVFLLSQRGDYYFDDYAMKEEAISKKARGGGHKAARGGHANLYKSGQVSYLTRNKRSVWNVATRPYREAHFATFPEELIVPMIQSGCRRGGYRSRPLHGRGHHRACSAETWKKLSRY